MVTEDAIRPTETVVDVHGVPTFVRDAGRGAPILFLHGPEDPEWCAALARLASEFRVVAPNHPGMGRTPLPSDCDDMGDLVDHYLDVIDTLHLAEATLVGVSFGGWIAVELAVALGSRLGRLVLVDAAGLRVGDTDLPEIYMTTDDDLARFLVVDPHNARLVFPPTDDPDRIERRLVQRATLARFTWHPYWHDPKLARRLRRIGAATLVLWGSDDRFIPRAHAHELTGRIPGATLRVIEGAGHLSHLDQPQRFGEAVSEFVRSTKSRNP